MNSTIRRDIRISEWQAPVVQVKKWQLIHKKVELVPRSTVNKKDGKRRNQTTEEDTWQFVNCFKRGKVNNKVSYHQQNFGDRSDSFYDWTGDHQMAKWEALGRSRLPLAIIKGPQHKSNVLHSQGLSTVFICVHRRLKNFVLYHKSMVCEGSRNASANRDLQSAQEAYETHTSLKEKHKI